MTLNRINMKNYKRNCPKCGKELNYYSKRNLNRAIENGKNCNTCRTISEQQKKDISKSLLGRKNPNYKRKKYKTARWIRNCPLCGNKINYYSKEWKYINAIKNNSCCPKCVTNKREVKWILSRDQINKMAATKAGYSSYEEYQKALPEFQRYKKEVIRQTNHQPIQLLPNFSKRGRAGTDGAYQLDHIISIWRGFREGITEEKIADISNLQMLPWLDNLKKHKL